RGREDEPGPGGGGRGGAGGEPVHALRGCAEGSSSELRGGGAAGGGDPAVREVRGDHAPAVAGPGADRGVRRHDERGAGERGPGHAAPRAVMAAWKVAVQDRVVAR